MKHERGGGKTGRGKPRRGQRREQTLRFAKMHGLGNDFMVIDLVTQHVRLAPERVRGWADRRTGVGFDQLLAVLPPDDPEADFRFRVFNANGSEAEQCGNGARCFARFVVEEGLTPKRRLTLQTGDDVTRTEWLPSGQVRVALGVPRMGCGNEAAPADESATATVEQVLVAGESVALTALSLGNPHAVMFVADVEAADVAGIGAALQSHERFPQQVNVGFLQVHDGESGRLRVYERGVGETRACGSGAGAAMVAARLHGHWRESATIALPGGELRARWRGGETAVEIEGPAELVYRGRIAC